MRDKLKPPSGILLTRKQAPELFALTDALCRQLNASRVRRVLITDMFNAGVVQLPRLGLFGWYKSWLLLGLPLMKCMTAEQFKTVLAHEIGHLAKGHSKMAHRIHQQQLRWSELAEMLGADLRGFIFSPFLKWFVPYFAACLFPLSRMNEYEADAAAARIVSPAATAEGLSASNVIDKYLQEQYWPQVYQYADELPEPMLSPYLAMGQNLAADVDAAWAMHWLAEDMQRTTGLTDSHPALQDRLHALQEHPRIVLPEAGQSAEHLLGRVLQTVIERMDKEWQNNIRPWWTERHQRVRQLAELNARSANGAELTVEEAYQRAQLTWSVSRNEDAALAQLLSLHNRAPQHPLACFGLGACLLKRQDDRGRALLEQAMRLDEHFTAVCCEMLRDYCWQIGKEEEAHGWHDELQTQLNLENASKRERSQVLLTDQFEPHGLAEDVVARMRTALKNIPGLRKAYLVRKRLKYSSQPPCYVLGYAVTAWFQFRTLQQIQENVQNAFQQIQAAVECPEETWIISVEGSNWRFRGKFSKVPGARLV